MRKAIVFFGTLMCFFSASAQTAPIRIDLQQKGAAVSPNLYGIFFEEINHAGAVKQAAAKAAQGGAPAYLYLFTWKPESNALGASHGMELPFMLHNVSLQREMTGASDRAYTRQQHLARLHQDGKSQREGRAQVGAIQRADWRNDDSRRLLRASPTP